MRHNLIGAIIPLAITLAGCTNDEISQRNDLPTADGRLPITIKTYLPGHTRGEADVATLSSLGSSGPGFHLQAQYNDDGTWADVISGDIYSADGDGLCTSRTANQLAYWPSDADAEVEFLAIYPATALNSTITQARNGNQELEVTFSANGTDDYLAAHRRLTRTADGAITLTFRHLQAQVVLAVKCDNAAYNYTLTSATLTMPNQAVYNCKEGTILANAAADDSTTITIFTVGETSFSIGETAARVGSFMANASDGTGSLCTLTIGYKTNIGGSVRTYTKSASVTLIAGYVNTITAQVAGDTPLHIAATVDGLPVYHEFVDLGLSVKWASANIGADTPTDYGDYFAWGEVTGFAEGKNNFDWTTYKWCEGSISSITKYVPTGDSYGVNFDDLSELLPEDDAATHNWGEHWRMPTEAEYQELISSCDAALTTLDGVAGYLFTAASGNSIFLPAAGRFSGSSNGDIGTNGGYWSATRNLSGSYNAKMLDFETFTVKGSGRCYGRSVRAVYVE